MDRAGRLYIVATPLGNLADISERALSVLSAVHSVFCEDTRHSAKLLTHYGIRTNKVSLHEHNEAGRSAQAVALLQSGHDVAYISDAGTPGVSDPGARLVAAAVAAGIKVHPIPGASALAAALSVCGFSTPATNVLFAGFLPNKGKERHAVLMRLCTHDGIAVFFEAPHRLQKTAQDLMAAGDPQRPVCVCRELTKLHEEVLHMSLAELVEYASDTVRGELTLVLGPLATGDGEQTDERDVDGALRRVLAAGLSTRDASAAVAAILQVSRKTVYQRCIQLAAGRS